MSVPISKNKMESNLTPGFSAYLHTLIHVLLVCKHKEEGRKSGRKVGNYSNGHHWACTVTQGCIHIE